MINGVAPSTHENKACLVVYRGPLERSRVAFILTGLSNTYSQLHVVWIFPGKWQERVERGYKEFAKGFPDAKWTVLRHRLKQFLETRRALVEVMRSLGLPFDAALVGDTAALFAPCLGKTKVVWFINGIPEERSMRNRLLGMLVAKFQWWLYSVVIQPHRIITVSSRMSNYVERHFPAIPMLAAPTCVDMSTFASQESSPDRIGRFCYLGTGAAWQALDQLSLLWQAIHKLDPTIKFRVISRDPRCKVLATGISSANIEFVESEYFHEVANFLQHSEVGFLIRRDNIINRVSFPTKLGEYVSAGCWVVLTALDWDASNYVDRFRVGYLASPTKSPIILAREILDYRAGIDGSIVKRLSDCANELDRSRWIGELGKFLSQ